jgi:hypothetical protein
MGRNRRRRGQSRYPAGAEAEWGAGSEFCGQHESSGSSLEHVESYY